MSTDQPIVLVVEDEPIIRMMLADEMADAGYRVLEAANGEEALVILRARADICGVVTDVRMPGAIDGTMVARSAAQSHPGCAIVVISGHAHPDDGLPPGSVFLQKPFRSLQVAALLGEMLSAKQSNRAAVDAAD